MSAANTSIWFRSITTGFKRTKTKTAVTENKSTTCTVATVLGSKAPREVFRGPSRGPSRGPRTGADASRSQRRARPGPRALQGPQRAPPPSTRAHRTPQCSVPGACGCWGTAPITASRRAPNSLSNFVGRLSLRAKQRPQRRRFPRRTFNGPYPLTEGYHGCGGCWSTPQGWVRSALCRWGRKTADRLRRNAWATIIICNAGLPNGANCNHLCARGNNMVLRRQLNLSLFPEVKSDSARSWEGAISKGQIRLGRIHVDATHKPHNIVLLAITTTGELSTMAPCVPFHLPGDDCDEWATITSPGWNDCWAGVAAAGPAAGSGFARAADAAEHCLQGLRE